jgi:ABC transporter substrate binding protein
MMHGHEKSQAADLAGKRLELLREVVPRLRRLVSNHGKYWFCRSRTRDGRGSSCGSHARPRSLATRYSASGGYQSRLRGAQGPSGRALRRARCSRCRKSPRILTLALGARLPTIFGTRDFVQAGALMSYGPNFPDQFRRAAELVDKILRGTKPADIPVEQPTKFDLVINVTTAQALGLTVPPSLLALADEVIE